MPEFMSRLVEWFQARSTVQKALIVIGVLVILAIVSPLAVFIAAVVLLISLVVLGLRMARRGSLRGPAIVAAVALVAVGLFSGISAAFYGGDPPQETTEIQEAAEEPVAEPEPEPEEQPEPVEEPEPEPEPVEEPEPEPAGPDTIPGRAITDVVVLAEDEGFECTGPHVDREAPAPAQVSYTCDQVGATGEQQVTARGENVSNLARVQVVAVDDYSFIEYIASIPYEGARPEEAQQWVTENLDAETATTEIGGVHFSIVGGSSLGGDPSVKAFEMVATGILATD